MNGLKSIAFYASIGQVVWPTDRCQGIVDEVICVLIEIAPVSNVQATAKSLPHTFGGSAVGSYKTVVTTFKGP